MKDNRTAPMAGDKALVLHAAKRCQFLIGKIVDITSNPTREWSDGRRYENFGISPAGKKHLRTKGQGQLLNRYQYNNINWAHGTSALLRIPPQEELQQIFKDECTPKTISA